MRGAPNPGFEPRFYQTNPFLGAFPEDTRDVHVYGHGRRDVSLGMAAGGLETLKLVQGLIDASLYRRFVAGEFGEGVSSVSIPDKAHT